MELSTRELAIAYWNSGRMKICQRDSVEKYFKGKDFLRPEEIEFVYISEMAEKGETVRKLYTKEELTEQFIKCNHDLKMMRAGDIRNWITENL